jgi:hypothetical protein
MGESSQKLNPLIKVCARDYTLERKILQEFCEMRDCQTDDLNYDSLFNCFDRCPVSQDNDRVIHCIFGKKNNCDYMLCDDANSRRDRLVAFVQHHEHYAPEKKYSHVKSAVLCFLKNMGKYTENITQYEQEARQIRELENEILKCLSDVAKSCDKIGHRFAEEWHLLPLYLSSLEFRSDEHPNIFQLQSRIDALCGRIDWTTVTQAYVKYLSDSDTVLGIPELAVLAECYGKKIVCYIENGNLSAPFVFNNAADEIFYVVLNDDGQLESLKPNVDRRCLQKYREFRRQKLRIELRRKKITCPYIPIHLT